MNWLEVALLIFGAGAFAGSFLIKGKVEKEDDGQQVDAELVRSFTQIWGFLQRRKPHICV